MISSSTLPLSQILTLFLSYIVSMIIHEFSHYIYGIIYRVTILGISLFSYYGVIGLYLYLLYIYSSISFKLSKYHKQICSGGIIGNIIECCVSYLCVIYFSTFISPFYKMSNGAVIISTQFEDIGSQMMLGSVITKFNNHNIYNSNDWIKSVKGEIEYSKNNRQYVFDDYYINIYYTLVISNHTIKSDKLHGSSCCTDPKSNQICLINSVNVQKSVFLFIS